MKKESAVPAERLSGLLKPVFRQILPALDELAAKTGREIFLVGGTVRDALLGLSPGDLDLTVARDAARCCRELIGLLAGGTFVDLGGTGEDVARVVFRGLTIDISGFRAGANSIEEDLCLRDYTVNALAIPLTVLQDGAQKIILIDPLNGQTDLEQGILRSCPNAFPADPLRMLRGFRLSATLGMEIESETLAEMAGHAALIDRAAAERITHELDRIMESTRAFATLWAMHGAGLLERIVPELYAGLGLAQPEFHHLDVFHHSFLALELIEAIIAQPARYYGDCPEELSLYLLRAEVRRCLKWAALLHDIGKPGTQAVQVERQDRVTFYGHDEEGRRLIQDLAVRLKWSNEDRLRVGGLIAMHMHPFHLCNVQRSEPLSKRAILKLCKRAGDELCGLFLLAMADSLASRGEKKPVDMEKELADLLGRVLLVYKRDIGPVVDGPPLLSGRDLIDSFALPPGPLFAVILKELEALRVEGRVNNPAEARAWVSAFLRERVAGKKNLTFDEQGSF